MQGPQGPALFVDAGSGKKVIGEQFGSAFTFYPIVGPVKSDPSLVTQINATVVLELPPQDNTIALYLCYGGTNPLPDGEAQDFGRNFTTKGGTNPTSETLSAALTFQWLVEDEQDLGICISGTGDGQVITEASISYVTWQP